MTASDMILNFIDELQHFIEFINTYIKKGIELFNQAKAWLADIIEYLEIKIKHLVNNFRGENMDLLEVSDDYMFV